MPKDWTTLKSPVPTGPDLDPFGRHRKDGVWFMFKEDRGTAPQREVSTEKGWG